ncbi:MAG: TRAP transporter large permease subunit, partial [Comamonadaceae bacterium]
MLKIIFLGLMASGLPVAIAMAGSALLYIWLSDSTLPGFVVIHRMVSGIDSFPLLAVPFFILAGNLMNNAGITNRIYNYALALVGWLKGGLGRGLATVVDVMRIAFFAAATVLTVLMMLKLGSRSRMT